MNGLPLHPAVIHLPLGLAFVLPCLALALSILIAKRKASKHTWLIVIALQAVVAGTGWYAEETGEDEEKHTVHRSKPRARVQKLIVFCLVLLGFRL